ncbi:antitoxin VbhA family protein [Flavobacterium humidisoli]|uniref:PcfK-like protein n=1 Tax=Flavobacterium humidisoli TaxID=2937442 RepID=A0ABY4LZ67_9FLAO|nr:antitoxin VbhA family protein [Flavobacterium humidisoli]UPZ17838.1 hypothetical protein M0M44_10920 [Flavobacterium humidisoli]
MSKEAKMMFWVESELQTKFFNIAFLEDRSAAEVLREFMKSYINQSYQHNNNNPVDTPPVNTNLINDLTPDPEYRYNENGISPKKPSDEALELARRIINGEIDLPEFVQTKHIPEPVTDNNNKEECKSIVSPSVAPINLGYKPSKEELEQARRFLNGEIKVSEFIIK